MKIFNSEQGSDQWKIDRAGKLTASCFDKCITAGGKESTQADAYENRLVAEKLVGHPIQEFEGNEDTERGNDEEQNAADFYSNREGVELVKVGFITNDEETIGCSPDRLIGSDGLLEIKVPRASTHVGYMQDNHALVKKYHVQVQGQLWVSGRKWCDVMSYHPEMRPVIVRVQRDEAFIAAMSRMVTRSANNVQAKYQKLKG